MIAPRLLILTGPPGSGKSTVGPLVAASFDRSAVLDADWFLGAIVGGLIDPWEPDADSQNRVVIGAAVSTALRMVRAGYVTV